MGEVHGFVSSVFIDDCYELTSSADFETDKPRQVGVEYVRSLAFRGGESTALLNCVYPRSRSCLAMCKSSIPNQFGFVHASQNRVSSQMFRCRDACYLLSGR